jgi:hypothetical protein
MPYWCTCLVRNSVQSTFITRTRFPRPSPMPTASASLLPHPNPATGGRYALGITGIYAYGGGIAPSPTPGGFSSPPSSPSPLLFTARSCSRCVWICCCIAIQARCCRIWSSRIARSSALPLFQVRGNHQRTKRRETPTMAEREAMGIMASLDTIIDCGGGGDDLRWLYDCGGLLG